jgi:hypothetical protein
MDLFVFWIVCFCDLLYLRGIDQGGFIGLNDVWVFIGVLVKQTFDGVAGVVGFNIQVFLFV